MPTELSARDMETAVDFIAAVEKLGLIWFPIERLIRTHAIHMAGGTTPTICCPISGRYAEEVGTVVSYIRAAEHYNLSPIVRDALTDAADSAESCIPRLRELILGLLPQAA